MSRHAMQSERKLRGSGSCKSDSEDDPSFLDLHHLLILSHHQVVKM